MKYVKNLPCPQCNSALTTDGRAWVECPACGYRHGVFVKPQPDGTYSVKLRTGGRKPVSRKKHAISLRIYDQDRAAVEERGYTVQSLLDEAVARVVAKIPGPCSVCGSPKWTHGARDHEFME